jgi:hypothetical protein
MSALALRSVRSRTTEPEWALQGVTATALFGGARSALQRTTPSLFLDYSPDAGSSVPLQERQCRRAAALRLIGPQVVGGVRNHDPLTVREQPLQLVVD